MTVSISSRIRRALLGLSIVLCVFFSGLTLLLLYVVEDQVFIDQIRLEQAAFKANNYVDRWQPLNGHMTKLHSMDELPDFFPEAFKSRITSNTGIHEYFDDNRAFFIAHGKIDNTSKSYFLVYDVNEFLAVRDTKSTLFTLVGLMTLLLVGIAAVVAHRLTKTILSPISKLTKALQTNEIDDVVITMANQFSNDEVGILTQELGLALERARDAAQREYEFNRGVSHELRTPIQAAQSATELLALSCDKQDPKQQKYVERLSRAMLEMNQIVEAFLWLAGGYNQSKAKNCTIEYLIDALQGNERLNFDLDAKLEEQHQYAIPESVLLIVLRSLIKNAETYGTGGEITLLFDEQNIRVSNACDENSSLSSGWGIGLTIAERLCNHFNYRLVVDDQDTSVFSVDIAA